MKSNKLLKILQFKKEFDLLFMYIVLGGLFYGRKFNTKTKG